MSKTQKYTVRAFDGTGARYLVEAKVQTNGKYRWAKCAVSQATKLTRDAARNAARHYGGEVVSK
jgi:hypothetical protein